MGNRSKVILECKVDGCRYRYHTTKNKKKTPGKLSFKKYCPDCKKHQVFAEKK